MKGWQRQDSYAAVAATITLCTVIPGSTGRAGAAAADLADQKRVVSVDSDSRAPKAFRSDLFDDEKLATWDIYHSQCPP